MKTQGRTSITVAFKMIGLMVMALGLVACSQAAAKDNGKTDTSVPSKQETAQLLAPPAVPPALNRDEPALVKVNLETTEVVSTLADGVEYRYWTFNDTVPGPIIRVRDGDTVELTLANNADSRAAHSIDLHAVNGPGGGAAVTQVSPGKSKTFTFRALNPGVYVYHCATPVIPQHIANGMYGLIIVEPKEGLPEVDKEFYVMQGDMYTLGDTGEPGLQEFSLDKMVDEDADYVVFNGSVGAITGENALTASVGETVRIYFGVGGPNLTSSFHVIGEIFDEVHQDGAMEAAHNVQTTLVPSGGATWVDFKVDVPGTYLLVDHSLGRLLKGAAGHLTVGGDQSPHIFREGN